MKIIVHFGKGKTGTTALQVALLDARAPLRARGVLFPKGTPQAENHHLLTALLLPGDKVRPDIRHLFGQDHARMQRAARAMWEQIKREVEQTRPKLVILSSEYFYDMGGEHFAALAALLSELSTDLQPCVYFREPAAHYLSLIQQKIKRGHPLFAPEGAVDRWIVPQIEAAFGRRIIAGNADRDALKQGDIVADFLSRAVEPHVGPMAVVSIRRNESISAEAMAILDRYRALRQSPRAKVFADLRLLRRLVDAAERRAGKQNKPKLLPEIAAAIRRGSGDLLWLRERYGLVFSGVDYAAIDDVPAAFDPGRTRIEDIIEVDADWRDALLAEALAEGLSAHLRASWLSRKLARTASAAREGVLAVLGRGVRRA